MFKFIRVFAGPSQAFDMFRYAGWETRIQTCYPGRYFLFSSGKTRPHAWNFLTLRIHKNNIVKIQAITFNYYVY